MRLEGLRDEEEAEHLIAALAGVGGWLRGAGTPREVSLVLRAALEQSALPGLEASGFAMRLGECAVGSGAFESAGRQGGHHAFHGSGQSFYDILRVAKRLEKELRFSLCASFGGRSER